MRGVFGAGVATAFEEADIYPNVKAVHAASAGAMTGAYFLSHQMSLGSSIYWEDLGVGFLSRKDFFLGIWQRFENRFIRLVSKSKMRDPLKVDILMDAIKHLKPLDAKRVIEQRIPFFVKFFEINTQKIVYLDARRSDIYKILEAGVSALPYTHEVAEIDGRNYIEGGIIEILGVRYLLEQYPDEKIIIIMNGQVDRKFRYKLKNVIEGKIMQWMFDDPRMYTLHASAEDRLAEDLRIIKDSNRVVLIAPKESFAVKSRTTNSKKIIAFYQHGIEEGRRVIRESLSNT